MDNETLKKLKTKLEDKKQELKKMVKELSSPPELGSDVDHFEEEADEAEEFSTNLGKAQIFHERLHKVKRALEKLASGEYGKCETCGKEIELKILEIDPESRCCRECKKSSRE